ncbi:MAG: hypothetical protein SGI88_20625, partial [Candidatus Hydrogenedentes bacterium]|nr:hypothetical protein [Candidatus Hydrogenedentota bacterium]
THAHGLREAITQDGAQTVRVTVTQELPANSGLSGNSQRNGSHAGPREQSHGPYEPPKQQHSPAGPRREPIHNGRLNVFA